MSLFDLQPKRSPVATTAPATPVNESSASVYQQDELLSYRIEIRKRLDAWKLTKAYCQTVPTALQSDCRDALRQMQLDLVIRRQIFSKIEQFQLSAAFCDGLQSGRNRLLCHKLFADQQALCDTRQTKGKRLIVDLGEQMMYGLSDCRLVVYSRTTTGKAKTPTPTGHYRIYEARGPHFMQGEWFVNMALYFKGGYAIHDANWRVSPFWRKENRAVSGSHGCVNTPFVAMKKVWQHFGVGDQVDIYFSIPEAIANEIAPLTKGMAMTDPEAE